MPPENYGQTVCSHLRRATSWEKADIQAELNSHIDDHAAALVEAGYDEPHAHRQAVEAMGDPEEVGKALDATFSRGWLILSRLALVFLVALLLVALFHLLIGMDSTFDSLQARIAPAQSTYHAAIAAEDPLYQPLDVSVSLGNGDVIRYYGCSIRPEGTSYLVHLYGVVYNKNPFSLPLLFYPSHTSLTYGDPPRTVTDPRQPSARSAGADYWRYELPGVQAGDTITVHLDRLGIARETQIDLPWEEVTQS